MNYLVTCDSLKVQHMLCKNFDNYVKGHDFRDIFEQFGDGFVTADSETWKYIRNLLHSLIKQRRFEVFVHQTVQKKVYTSLLPILDHAQQQGRVVDLQDILNRFTFDNICSTIVGHDPKEGMEEAPFDLLTALITEERGRVHDDKFLRDAAFNLFAAGRETITSVLTWFFWLIAKHPIVEAKIIEEIRDNLKTDEKKNNHGFLEDHRNHNLDQEQDLKKSVSGVVLGMEEVKKLVYLHGALCEVMRLFPPVPIERKQAVKADTLPSGHRVNGNTMIIFSPYAMGTNEEIWSVTLLRPYVPIDVDDNNE
ncbi:Alkane hydroxylase [Vigna angularis]|uniref:Alkane hydroxylase n=1 Tax=Phaseolus angularis TaxID=3914 RepID=A0A8T0JX06_PHAAN|nr:Alkane hydroxylase [Vigna angularis]